ncbi:hypothetical protein [Lysobacter sp. M15]|uniref:hypothetical protein n=1 Tax=Lysobacter sp. M15 TaxID=2916837 RepID=UPI001F569DDD|nr:hypothetical protein [Lysobacter sp. M15]
MKISEYDVVRVIAEIPADRIDLSASQGRPQIGDLGAVVLVHTVKPNQEPAFIVECVGSDGHTIWLADILASELERVPSSPGGT